MFFNKKTKKIKQSHVKSRKKNKQRKNKQKQNKRNGKMKKMPRQTQQNSMSYTDNKIDKKQVSKYKCETTELFSNNKLICHMFLRKKNETKQERYNKLHIVI